MGVVGERKNRFAATYSCTYMIWLMGRCKRRIEHCRLCTSCGDKMAISEENNHIKYVDIAVHNFQRLLAVRAELCRTVRRTYFVSAMVRKARPNWWSRNVPCTVLILRKRIEGARHSVSDKMAKKKQGAGPILPINPHFKKIEHTETTRFLGSAVLLSCFCFFSLFCLQPAETRIMPTCHFLTSVTEVCHCEVTF